jgi:hypothetical protein
MITSTSVWWCKCGVQVKVIGQTDWYTPHEKVTAECPNCGDRQVIYAHRIISVTAERLETGKRTARNRKSRITREVRFLTRHPLSLNPSMKS